MAPFLLSKISLLPEARCKNYKIKNFEKINNKKEINWIKLFKDKKMKFWLK
jgi:hypothetical protein